MPIHGDAHPDQREQVKLQIASPSSEIIGEGAAIFTDMTETILDVLDKQVATSPGSQQHAKGLSSNDDQKEMIKSKEPRVSTQKEDYPDLFHTHYGKLQDKQSFSWLFGQFVHR